MAKQPVQYQRVLPPTPLEDRTQAFRDFFHIEAVSGIVLIFNAAIALVAANSAWSELYQSLWETKLTIGVEGFELSYPLWYWINDALMAVFFFVVGLEIKRELVQGELSDPRNVLLPTLAAFGGAAVPALIFFFIVRGTDAVQGWAVPMATDIAFVVGCLALLGSKVPRGLKVFLLAIAIVDDLIAVAIIALFLSKGISVPWVIGAVACLGLVLTLRALHVRTISIYVAIGAVMWLCTLKAGIHPTVAGVILGLLTPASARVRPRRLQKVMKNAGDTIESEKAVDEEGRWSPEGREASLELAEAATDAVSPMNRLERLLHPWVSYWIMPIFALANAGVVIAVGTLTNPIVSAVAFGLVVGKPLGITLGSWLAVRMGARLPKGVDWTVVAGAGCLAGIGFTMAIFIASLSLSDDSLTAAKTGVLLGSLVSAILGMGLLSLILRRQRATE